MHGACSVVRAAIDRLFAESVMSGGYDMSTELKDRINTLKAERAQILAHNYQLPEVQDIADCGGFAGTVAPCGFY